jgi:PilZ domain-containing protein
MSGKGGQENRREPRVSLSSEVECEVDSGHVRWRFADLSAGGMFIDVYDPLPTGTLFRLRFLLEPPPIAARAQVHYAQPRIGMGVEFVELAQEDRQRIREIVDRLYTAGRQRGDATLRRSARVLVHIPVKVGAVNGAPAVEMDDEAAIVKLSKNGGCISTRHRVGVGEKLRLFTNSGREFVAGIVWVGDSSTKTDGQVGIQCRGLAQALGFQFP